MTLARACIVFRSTEGRRVSSPLSVDHASLGRDPGCTVEVPLRGVSRNHATIAWDGKHHWLEDARSTNGTFVNGEPAGRARLRHLDVISLGRTADVLFVLWSEGRATAARRSAVRVTLVPENGEPPYDVAIGECILGRSSACNVVASDESVSKFHARLERSAERLTLTDLGSSNGTLVNGREIESASLGHGDVIDLAGAERYRVQIEGGDAGLLTSPGIAPSGPAEPRQRFSRDWKTRLEWDTAELEELQERIASQAPGRQALGRAAEEPRHDGTLRPARPRPRTAAPKASRNVARGPSPALAIREVGISGVGVSHQLTEPGPHLLGRSREATLRFQDPTIHGKHAVVELAEDRRTVEIRDLGGPNGTFVNGAPVQRAKLEDGDALRLGEAELLVTLQRE